MAAAPEPRALSVLVVDDNPAMRMVARAALEATEEHIEVFEAESLDEALDRVAGASIGAVVLDLGLPDSQGLDTVRRFRRAAPRDLAVVVVTGLEDREIALEALREGAQDYIVKGQLDHGTLGRAIRYAIERMRAAEERERLRESLASADRLASMGLLAAGVAHEINNPLAYVLDNLEHLSAELARLAAGPGNATARPVAEPESFDDLAERAREALEGLRRIQTIARGLGIFSRVDNDRVGPIDLRGAIEAAIGLAVHEVKYRARLSTDFGATAAVIANEGRLSQAFLTLLVTSARSIDEGQVDRYEIRVRTWQEGDEVFVEVRDTGPGMSADELRHLFDPFTSPGPGRVGSGLGLSIARSFVTAHGGQLEVVSEVGVGTAYTVRLPAAVAPVHAAAPAPRPEALRGRVLVVDDEPAIRRILRRILKRHDVIEADSGEQALALLAAGEPYDAVVCDLMMPKVSGVDVHRWIVRERPALADAVVFITGGTFTQAARDYLATVRNRQFEKPFDAEALEAEVTAQVDASRDRRA